MTEFETEAILGITVDRQSLQSARDEVESELAGVANVTVDQSGRATVADGGGPGGGNTLDDLSTLQEDQLDVLEDILDELEGGLGGGGPGGPGLPFFGGGGGGGGGGGFIEGLFASDLIRRFFGGSGGGGGSSGGGRFGGLGIAGSALLTNQLIPLLTNRDAPAGGVVGPDNPIQPGPVDQAIAAGFDAVLGEFSNIDVGGGGGDGDTTPAMGAGPRGPQGPDATTPDTGPPPAPGPDESGPRGRFAGSPSGSDRGLSAAERAIFSGGRQPSGRGGTTVAGLPTGFQSVDGGRDGRDRAREARDRGQASAEVTVNADLNLQDLDRELRRLREDILREVERRFRDFGGGPGR